MSLADCLAVATAEQFAVIIDAKVRRRGYTLGTDDRQFCEYAKRHTRELALSGIDKVSFTLIGRRWLVASAEEYLRYARGRSGGKMDRFAKETGRSQP